MKKAFIPVAKPAFHAKHDHHHPVGVIVPLYHDKKYGIGFVALDDIQHYYQPHGSDTPWTRVVRHSQPKDEEYSVAGIHIDHFVALLRMAEQRQECLDFRDFAGLLLDKDADIPRSRDLTLRNTPA